MVTFPAVPECARLKQNAKSTRIGSISLSFVSSSYPGNSQWLLARSAWAFLIKLFLKVLRSYSHQASWRIFWAFQKVVLYLHFHMLSMKAKLFPTGAFHGLRSISLQSLYPAHDKVRDK